MKKLYGFSFIELMTAVAVVAIALAIGVPSFQSVIEDNRLTAYTNDLVTALQLARSEAVKRGARVEVCASINGVACGGNYSNGWIVRVTDATDALYVQSAVSEGYTLTGPTVTYNPVGTVQATGPSIITVTKDTKSRCVRVAPSGRIQSGQGGSAVCL